jgi:hypothetical protein
MLSRTACQTQRAVQHPAQIGIALGVVYERTDNLVVTALTHGGFISLTTALAMVGGGSTGFRPSRCSPSGRSSLDAPRSVVPFVTHPGDARGNCSGDYSCQNGRAALSRPGCDEIADDEPDCPVEYRVQAPLHSTLLAFTGKIVRHRMRAVACDCSCQWQIHALYPISAE